MNSFFDKIIFIHCSHRKDRLENIKQLINKFNLDNYYILNAKYFPYNGAKGCSYSHYLAMKYSIDNNLKNCLILEDDYFISQNTTNINSFFNNLKQNLKNKSWDVIMLWWLLNGVNKRTIINTKNINNKNLLKITHKKYGASSTLAYAVNQSMFEILKNLFYSSYQNLDDNYNHHQKHLKTDMIWRNIQHKYQWFLINPIIGEQINSKSDIHIWN